MIMKDNKKVNYEEANRLHAQVIKKIREIEETRVSEPTDSIQMACVLVGKLETSAEYVEGQNLARNDLGQILRQKVKITLSYQPGSNPISALFRNV
jgi:5,10-methylene-tetrahydrofolate dehydrogenase/methenyl tetrahydrofolate cyclohydrolase